MPSIKTWLIQNRDKYTDRKQYINDCIKELNVRRGSVLFKSRFIWPAKEKVVIDKDSEKDIIDPKSFIAEIDIVDKVHKFLDAVVKDGYIEDEKLRKRFDISRTRWKELVRLPIFEDHILTYDCGNARKQTVWSSKEGIQIVRSTVSMARYDN